MSIFFFKSLHFLCEFLSLILGLYTPVDNLLSWRTVDSSFVWKLPNVYFWHQLIQWFWLSLQKVYTFMGLLSRLRDIRMSDLNESDFFKFNDSFLFCLFVCFNLTLYFVSFSLFSAGFLGRSRLNGTITMWRAASRGLAAPRFWRHCTESTLLREDRFLISQVTPSSVSLSLCPLSSVPG